MSTHVDALNVSQKQLVDLLASQIGSPKVHQNAEKLEAPRLSFASALGLEKTSVILEQRMVLQLVPLKHCKLWSFIRPQLTPLNFPSADMSRSFLVGGRLVRSHINVYTYVHTVWLDRLYASNKHRHDSLSILKSILTHSSVIIYSKVYTPEELPDQSLWWCVTRGHVAKGIDLGCPMKNRCGHNERTGAHSCANVSDDHMIFWRRRVFWRNEQ